MMKAVLGSTLMGAVLFSAPILTVTQTANAAATDNLNAAEKLSPLLSGVKSMTANFTQTTQGAGARNGNFSGTMSVQRPNQFRWQTASPAEQLIVANGDTLWVYDKDLKQATKQNVDRQVGNTPALLLSGDPKRIAENFKVTQPNTSRNYFELYPKSSNANFQKLGISFNSGKPVRMVLIDSLGQTTSIRFSNVRLNGNISASKFSFTPPEGVDVINQ